MFRDHEAQGSSYDTSTDSFVVRCDDLPRTGDAKAQLLLDVSGHLVGIDCGGTDLERLVVMLGPHEAVHSTKDAKVKLEKSRVVISGARKLLPVADKNPYR
ncbi:hypothetical protein BH09MYX1_BH09MYX1_20350 [soil metagenome]